MRKELPVGTKYGLLTIVRFHHSNKKTTFYECQCQCGNTHIVERGSLVNGLTKSCGCLRQSIIDRKYIIISEFEKLYNKGLSDDDIAKQLNVSKSLINHYRNQLGLIANNLKRESPKYVDMWLNAQPYKVPNDPESLYHDTAFLQKLVNKKLDEVIPCGI